MAPLPIIDALFPRSEADASELDPRNPISLPNTQSIQARDDSSTSLSPLQARDLLKRSTDIYKRDVLTGFNPGQGTKPPESFNNQLFLGLFASIGALMVLASLWFFFFAKNGGFHFQQGDWDDYKSTVLRRKGPDGKTLSNATKSTKLGGSTIAGTQHFKWAKQQARSVVSRDEKGRKGVLAKRGWAKTHSILYSDDYMTETFGTQTVSDMTEIREEPHAEYKHHSKRYRDRDMQEYKKERPARVGGLNRVADGSHVSTNINGSDLSSAASERPILKKHKDKAAEREHAERVARVEAGKMERRWKREAEEAAAALARESARAIPQPKKSVSPTKPSPSKQRERQPSRSVSRSASPKKRDFSYNNDEVLSTAYTGTSSNRTASYYEAYRPRAASNPRYPSDHAHANRSSRQSSPKKKPQQGGRHGGYRRGADADLD